LLSAPALTTKAVLRADGEKKSNTALEQLTCAVYNSSSGTNHKLKEGN
jgi:hypothetical protein